MPRVEPDDETQAVLLGCLINEHLRLWRSDGRAECVRVLHPSALRPFLARGVAPRTSLQPARHWELGRIDTTGVLIIGKRPFAVEVCEEPEVSEALWAAAAEMFEDAAADAIARGEYLLVEPGGWAPETETYAVAGARKTPGEWLLYVESVPAPRGPSWPEPPVGEAGWGVAAPADDDALAALGNLVAEAVSMWADSPLDAVLTFGKQPAGPWPPAETPPAIDSLLADIRADVEELHTVRSLAHALDLSATTGVHFNHNTYPVYFTGDLQAQLVLVQPNPQQAENHAAQYKGGFNFGDANDYLERHRRSGHYRWLVDLEDPSPFDYKQARFLRHWGVVDFPATGTADEQRTNLANAVDQRLQLELIPYGSPKFSPDALRPDVLAPYYERLMRVITAYPRDYVILCGAIFDALFALHIVKREDHHFRLPTSTGISRVEYRFSNLLLAFDSGTVPVGLATHFAAPGIPMDAYGEKCHELYRELPPA